MENDKVDLISKDLEFVKDTVQETGRRISSLESSMSDFHKDFSEHIATDRQMGHEITYIRKTLEKNTESLIEHMRRTELNEAALSELKAMNDKMDSRLEPLEKSHIEKQTIIKVVAKISAFIGGLIGFASLMYEILSK
jgi:chromosome segregation ATPase